MLAADQRARVSPRGIGGLDAFVYRFALPAMLLRAMAPLPSRDAPGLFGVAQGGGSVLRAGSARLRIGPLHPLLLAIWPGVVRPA